MNKLISYELKKRMRNLKHKKIISKKIKSTINTIKVTIITIIVTTISTIIATIIATIFATVYIDTKKEETYSIQEHEKLLLDLQTICIGCNKEWMDSAFGVPVFTNIDETTKEDVYITEIAIIRAFYDINDDSCEMFFVTQTTEEPIPFMPQISYRYNYTIGERSLGNLPYDEVEYCGNTFFFTAYGFMTNGSGRIFYGEGYHGCTGLYADLYFASLDYGVYDPWDIIDDIKNPVFSNDFSKQEIAYYEQLNCDDGYNSEHFFLAHRSRHFPNTYGISSLDSDYSFEKLMDYNTFDSSQMLYR